MRRSLLRFLRSGARDERGAVAVFFAVALVVLTPLVLGALDIYMMSIQRSRLQDALDAAALYAARSTATDPADITAIGQKALNANIKLIPGAQLHGSSFNLVGNKIVAQAILEPTSIASNLWAHGNMTVGAEVVRSSMNLEVAMVLDITGSMSGQPIIDLKAAATDLVDLVVQPTQTPYYSKIAIIPYSNSVNVGSYAASTRGATTGAPKTVTGAVWKAAGATNKDITGITKANPAVVTVSGHGYATNDWVYIDGVKGMTTVNGRVYQITVVNTNTFRLNGVNSSSYSSYQTSSNDFVTKCAKASCASTITATAHGFANGDKVAISGVGVSFPNATYPYLDNLNGGGFTVANKTTNAFDITGAVSAGYTYTSAGKAYCGSYGCDYLVFTNADSPSAQKAHQISTCASERTGAEAYTDAAPTTALLGRVYPPASGNVCPAALLTPLSSDKTTLKATIASLAASGSTAGHIGVGWGWYMISPNFAYLWPSASQPAAYTKTDVLKVVVLMTDGAFNTAYANGVIAQDSGSGSGSATDHINLNATNGDAFTQATTLCQAMRAKGITIYTVGFNLGSDVAAQNVMNQCATDAQHVYLPSSGTALKTAFKAIAQDINSLRLAH